MDEKILNTILNIFIVGVAIAAVTDTVWQLMEQMSPPLQTIDSATAPLSTLSEAQTAIQNMTTLEQLAIAEASLL